MGDEKSATLGTRTRRIRELEVRLAELDAEKGRLVSELNTLQTVGTGFERDRNHRFTGTRGTAVTGFKMDI